MVRTAKGARQRQRKGECLLAERNRAAPTNSSSSASLSSVLSAKSGRQDYAAILDVGKYPAPKEKLQSSEGADMGGEASRYY